MAPIVAELYDGLYETVKLSYQKSKNPIDWTKDAERELLNMYNQHVDEKMRRIILHGLLLEYLYNEIKCEEDLKRWVEGRFIK